jgi:hypothetical protein
MQPGEREKMEQKLEDLREMLEDNPTWSLAPIVATEIARLEKKLRENDGD